MGPGPREARHDGQAYLRANPDDPQSWGVYRPDDRTLVAAQGELLLELIEDRKASGARHPWDEAWRKVPSGQVMLALETRWLRRRLAQAMQGGPQAPVPSSDRLLKFESFSPLLDKAQTYALSLRAAEKGLTVDLVASARTEQDARPVNETLQALVT